MTRSRATQRIVRRLLGDFLREIAVLVAVFVPLEIELQTAGLTLQAFGVIVVVVALFFAVGVLLEVKS